jgi:hypothetical protein
MQNLLIEYSYPGPGVRAPRFTQIFDHPKFLFIGSNPYGKIAITLAL